MLIILTNKLDPHADHLIKMVGQDFPILRINTDDFLSEYSYEIKLARDGSLGGEISDHFGRRYCFNSKAVGWYRRPFYDHLDVSSVPDFADMARSEVKSLIDAICNLPTIHWVNKPSAVSAARTKPAQLILAARLGLLVPSTLITNIPKAAHTFLRDAEDGVITKSIYSASMKHGQFEYTCVTQRVPTTIAPDDLEAVSLCPTQFQHEIRKDCDVRVTVIGHDVFACRIDSQLSDETTVDWRIAADRCRHSIISLPEYVEDACRRIISLTNLDYGAIDLVLDRYGQYWFLENNPSGQYLWIEQETGAPITAALIRHFKKAIDGREYSNGS